MDVNWSDLILSLSISAIVTVFSYLLLPTLLALLKKKFTSKQITAICIINCVVVWFAFQILRIALDGEPSAGAAVFLWGGVGYWILRKNCLKKTNAASDKSTPAPDKSEQIRVSLSVEGETPRTQGNYHVYGSNISLSQTTQKTSAQQAQIKPQAPQTPKQVPTTAPKKVLKYCSQCGKPIDPETKKCTGCSKQYFKGFKSIFQTIVILFATFVIVILTFLTMFMAIENAKLRSEIIELTSQASENS